MKKLILYLMLLLLFSCNTTTDPILDTSKTVEEGTTYRVYANGDSIEVWKYDTISGNELEIVDTVYKRFSIDDRMIFLKEFNLQEIPYLSRMQEVTYLDLSFNKSLSDVSPLQDLTTMTSLDFSLCYELTDISPLVGLTSMKTLDLDFCRKISDLSPIQNMDKLENLYMYDLAIKDLNALKGKDNLKRLRFVMCDSISDLTALASNINLNRLEMGYCDSLKDISPIKDLVNLTYLSFTGSPVADLTALQNLTSLEKLIFGGTFSKIENLELLSNVNYIWLGNCDNLIDISGLGNMASLDYVTLSRNPQLIDLTPLSDIQSLKTLNLWSLEFETIENIDTLTNVTKMDLSRCSKLTDISFLEKVPNLEILKMVDCDLIADFSPLVTCLADGDTLNLTTSEFMDKNAIVLPDSIRTSLLEKGVTILEGSNDSYYASNRELSIEEQLDLENRKKYLEHASR